MEVETMYFLENFINLLKIALPIAIIMLVCEKIICIVYQNIFGTRIKVW